VILTFGMIMEVFIQLDNRLSIKRIL
jgi:hypothetical protein